MTAAVERLAVWYSDDSFGILEADATIEDAQRIREFSDQGASQSEWTKIVRIRFDVIETLYDPAAASPTAESEMDKLRAENAALRAKLAGRP